MSPEPEYLLLHDVVPRLGSAIPIAVAPVGSGDEAELLQDGTVMSAKILTNATSSGKRVTARNIAYYTLQQLKSGRRTVGGGIRVTQFPSVRQLLPEFSGRPSTNLIPSRRSETHGPKAGIRRLFQPSVVSLK